MLQVIEFAHEQFVLCLLFIPNFPWTWEVGMLWRKTLNCREENGLCIEIEKVKGRLNFEQTTYSLVSEGKEEKEKVRERTRTTIKERESVGERESMHIIIMLVMCIVSKRGEYST